MPVYLVTVHAYRSWNTDETDGYVQRGEGLKEPDEERARYRDDRARHPEMRFELDHQESLHRVATQVSHEKGVRLHAIATCPTHAHVLCPFEAPHVHAGL
jgi:hypothetical protein